LIPDLKENRLKMAANYDRFSESWKIATFLQSAECTVVKQPNLAAPHSELVGGGY
jgi:hypothetical protein